LLGSFECASLSASHKRTEAITQAGLGSQTVRSGTVGEFMATLQAYVAQKS